MNDIEQIVKTEGGPAFPTQTQEFFLHGMTLREWFAGQALTALSSHSQSSTYIAQKAWEIADAMLAQKRMLERSRVKSE